MAAVLQDKPTTCQPATCNLPTCNLQPANLQPANLQPTMPTFYVEIVSPTGSIFRGEAERLRAPGVVGTFEVLHNHAPLTAAIDIGPIFVTTSGGERIAFATTGGFLEVLNNTVTILAEAAEPASSIDVERAKAAEARALARLATGVEADKERAKRALERARLRVSMGQVGTTRHL
jgi:F-type H+-transporting ATPase subunit epsilon